MWPCCCRCHVCRSVTTQKNLKKIKGRGIFQTHLVQYLWLSRDKHSVVHKGFNRCLWHHHERSGRTQRHPDSDNRYRCNPAANRGDSVASLSSPVMYGRTQDGGRTTCEMGDAAHSRLKKKVEVFLLTRRGCSGLCYDGWLRSRQRECSSQRRTVEGQMSRRRDVRTKVTSGGSGFPPVIIA